MTNFSRTSNRTSPLTIAEIAQYAPSALAMEAAADRSSRYAYIPTINVIEGMQKAGFLPFSATQSKTRDAARKEHTKHMIRFRHESATFALAVGDSLSEVILINSHDGTSAYKLMAGIFRLVCSNGLIISDTMQDSISIRHSGNVIDAVIEGSTRIVQNAPKMLSAVNQWTNLQLTDGEQNAFAEAARIIRFSDAEGNVDTPITAAQLLAPRRNDDRGNDLWKTMNRVQENVIRGGLRTRHDEQGNRLDRRVSTRAVKGIDQDVKLNRALWSLAEKMAELKAA